MKTTTKTERREIERLVGKYPTGKRGLAWGGGRGGKCHFVIHDGEGVAGGYSAATLTNEQLQSFADKFVRSLSNAAHLPAIQALIAESTAGLRATLRRLSEELHSRPLVVSVPMPVAPYNPRTAIVPVASAALAVRGERAA